jgi:hypothetical protein
VLWFYLSWRDPRVKGQVQEAYEKMAAPNSTYKCELPCQVCLPRCLCFLRRPRAAVAGARGGCRPRVGAAVAAAVAAVAAARGAAPPARRVGPVHALLVYC